MRLVYLSQAPLVKNSRLSPMRPAVSRRPASSSLTSWVASTPRLSRLRPAIRSASSRAASISAASTPRRQPMPAARLSGRRKTPRGGSANRRLVTNTGAGCPRSGPPCSNSCKLRQGIDSRPGMLSS